MRGWETGPFFNSSRKKGKVDKKKEINRNADDRIDRINGIYKTEGQRDRVMYHKLQLVGCPRFISRHKRT